MGKTKKPFIDKKNASTYHLLYRSQRDVADGDADNGSESGNNSGVVLWPSPNNNPETDEKILLGKKGVRVIEDGALSQWKNQLSEAGLVDDFDYEEHTKPITGTGQYFANNTKNMPGTSKREVNFMLDARARDVKDEIVQEVDRQLDSIALTSDHMDEEIAQMLFGDFEEGEFEELNDEFVLDAAKEPEATADGDQAFDFAAHVQGLIDKAKMESHDEAGMGGLSTIHEQGKMDQDFFSKAKRVGKGYDDDNDDDGDSGYFDENDTIPGIVPKLTQLEEQALCDKFNEALAEYDSDELGEGYDDDDVIGNRPLEGDTQVEAALDDYLQERDDDIFMQGNRHYMDGPNNGGSGFAALVGTKMVPVKDINLKEIDCTIRPMDEILGEADDTLRNPHAAPPIEEVFIDGKSYYSERMRNPWDCESILSTYSNLDNNPMTIASSSRRRRRKPKKGKSGLGDDDESTASAPAQQHQIIQLSEKTGLPLEVLPSGHYTDDGYCPTLDGADTMMSVNKGEKRHKNESAEEKKLRKLNVKKERQVARMQKKMMKEAFNDEFNKRQNDLLVDDMGGTSVFRF